MYYLLRSYLQGGANGSPIIWLFSFFDMRITVFDFFLILIVNFNQIRKLVLNMGHNLVHNTYRFGQDPNKFWLEESKMILNQQGILVI